ncbi:pyridoxal phosphate-dependent aminotransferase [Sporolactobacillus terrae]|uniref:Aminotransferase n=1 Tax=Sporolactobacillus terrae TaxID=269673 RepID=A0A410DCT1_9BACL|nr:pyridoxal phosphate-dependent aminotransferase [Sporolactobacillus terrae]QAA23934.1 aminotransferase class V-fold PLP-dependent enzyme [Sporolactobacillus terrae]QAA26903.1 aminotransferase class V-fold PLP-dependent enzyme [Sporolactobacillus terrae]UAK16244.1 pyridoxal phosphate-dependent aminotransferase [Sporolactobacillus terrae]BBN97711.1 aminotransferase [Sporolactobacillus terrae]
MTHSLVSKMKKELSLIQPSDILKFDQEASAIPGIIKLTIGEPDFNTPEHVKEAGKRSIDHNRSHYAPPNGTPELRQAISRFLEKKYGLFYNADHEILVTAGATEAIYTVLTSILNPGDKVLMPTPIFPLYIPDTLLAKAEPVFMDTSDNGFVLSPELLEKTLAEHGDAVKAVIFNFPCNPTGVTYRRDQIEALANVLKKHDIFVICDDIYSELTYGERHISMAEYLPNQAIVINGASKSHAMTGWRIGFICAPAAIATELGKIHQFTITSTATVAQDAALEAFENGIDDGVHMRAEYQKRRDFVYEAMSKNGFDCVKPQGAFYLFAKIPAHMIQNSMDFSRDLAHKAKVAVIPGGSFGPGGEGYIRISYAASMEQLQEAMRRIAHYVETLKEQRSVQQ